MTRQSADDIVDLIRATNGNGSFSVDRTEAVKLIMDFAKVAALDAEIEQLRRKSSELNEATK